MNYKGYVGKIEYDEDAHIFAGEVINTRTVITFQGETVREIEDAFRNSVDDYLEWCAEDGIEPEKPYSGKFQVRINPAIHQEASIKSKLMGISLNSFVEKAIEDELLQG